MPTRLLLEQQSLIRGSCKNIPVPVFFCPHAVQKRGRIFTINICRQMSIHGESFHHDTQKKVSTNVWMGKPLHFPTQADRGSLYTTVKSMYVIHDGGVAPHCTITLKTFLKNDDYPEQKDRP
jgi:hypothetical protein